MDYTEIVVCIVRLLVAAMVAFLIPYIKSKYTQDQLDKWADITDIAVAAAEQLYNSTQGKEKKEYVFKYLQDKGINLDAETIENLIESSVLRLHDELYGTEK